MNNNTAAKVCIPNFRSDQFVHVTKLIWQISGLFSVIIGVPGHLLQIILLSNRTSRKEPTSWYFIVIAISEIIFLLGLFWLWCANTSLIKIDPREILSCGIFYNILIGSTTLSNLYLASMSIDQSLMILYPVRYRSIVTQSHVTIRILLITLIVVILLIPHHFYLTYEPQLTLFLCNFHSSANQRRIRLWALIHAILFVSVPAIIVCISSFILLHNRCKYKRTYKKNLSPSARRLHRHSIVIFFVSLGIFFCLLPSGILEVFIVYDRLITHENRCSIRWKVYRILLNCFLALSSINYSVKFYIHLIVSTSFRQQFIRLLTCKSPPDLSRPNKENKNEQHLLSSVVHTREEL